MLPAPGQGVTRLRLSSRAWARRLAVTADDARDRGGPGHPASRLLPRWRGGDLDRMLNARSLGSSQIGGSKHSGLACRIRCLAPRGVVLDLGRARRDRHPRVASGRACAARDGTQDGRSEDANEMVGTVDRKRRLAAQGRERAWLGCGDGLRLGHRVCISDKSATDRGTWSDVARRVPRRRSVDPSMAAATRSASGSSFNVVRRLKPRPAHVGASSSKAQATATWPDERRRSVRLGIYRDRRRVQGLPPPC